MGRHLHNEFSFYSQLIKLEHQSHSPIKSLQKWINVGFSIGALGHLDVWSVSTWNIKG